MTISQWEKYSEDNNLYLIRATDKEINPQRIIQAIVNKK